MTRPFTFNHIDSRMADSPLSQFYARYRDPERAKALRALTQVVRERARRSGVSEAMLLRELRRAFVAAGRRV